jgi:membrane protein required for colicin V production
MNLFDAAVYLALVVAVVAGFRSGLLRSLATIFGYVAAMPVTLAIVPRLSGAVEGLARTDGWVPFVLVFLALGFVLAALLRFSITEMVGPQVSIPDRVAGAALGAVRVGLLAVLMILVFDRIIPSDRQPGFLANSQLRPALSRAGQAGLRGLPPDVADYVDRLKRERGI